MVQIFYINYNKGFLHTMILNNLKNKSLETKKQMKYNSIFNSYAYYVICTFFSLIVIDLAYITYEYLSTLNF